MTKKVIYEKYNLTKNKGNWELHYSGYDGWYPEQEKEVIQELINEIIDKKVFNDPIDKQQTQEFKNNVEKIIKNRKQIIQNNEEKPFLTDEEKEEQKKIRKILLTYEDRVLEKVIKKADIDVDKIVSSFIITTKAFPGHASKYTNYYNDNFSDKDAKCSSLITLKQNSDTYKLYIKKLKKNGMKIFNNTQSFFGPYIENEYNKEFQQWYDTLLDQDNQIATITFIEEISDIIIDGKNNKFYKSL